MNKLDDKSKRNMIKTYDFVVNRFSELDSKSDKLDDPIKIATLARAVFDLLEKYNISESGAFVNKFFKYLPNMSAYPKDSSMYKIIDEVHKYMQKNKRMHDVLRDYISKRPHRVLFFGRSRSGRRRSNKSNKRNRRRSRKL